ncbi:MAG: hypothetical protein GX793_01605 [Bacteroidales bacterium]|jgi:uncharacterized membrane protein|nr:hypothetical protein [Bacteroidales bacterium]MCK9500190.1 hypothetical protein [Bacteroidales bacterium]NLB85735.1 hypothetical protein [Bacteroidales bacterium]
MEVTNNIVNDDAALWFANRHENVEIQNYEAPSFVDLEQDDKLNDLADAADVQSEKLTKTELNTQLNMLELNKPTAKIIVQLMDVLVPVVIVLIIKGADSEELKLTPEETQTLTEAWALYLRDSNVQMSPGMVLLGTIGIIYGSKVVIALQTAKENKKAEQEEQELKEAVKDEIVREMARKYMAEQEIKQNKDEPKKD